MRTSLVTALALISMCASIAVVSAQGTKVTLSVEGAAVADVASKTGFYAQYGQPMGMEMMGGRGTMGMPANPANVSGLGMPGPSASFGTPPGRGTATATTPTTAAGVKQPTFLVIPLFRASPQLVGYALGADDEIWDEGGGGGSGGYGGDSSSGRSGYGGSSGYGSSDGSSSSSRGGSSRGGSSRTGGRSSGDSSSRY